MHASSYNRPKSLQLSLAVISCLSAANVCADIGIAKPVPIQSGILQQGSSDSVTELQALPSNVMSVQELGKEPTPATLATDSANLESKQRPATSLPVKKLGAMPLTLTPKQPDETALWRLLETGDFEATLDAIEKMRTQYSDWQTPTQLLQLAQEGLQRQNIDTAIANKNYDSLIKLAEESPLAFSCSHIDRAWSLAEAYAAQLRPEDTFATLQRLIPNCPNEQDRMATLHKSRGWLDAEAWQKLLLAEAPSPRTSSGESAYRRLRYAHALEQLIAASKRKDGVRLNGQSLMLSVSVNAAESTKPFESLSSDISEYHDSGAALIGAWNYFQLEDYQTAIRWFSDALAWDDQRHEAMQGIALCYIKQSKFKEAFDVAEKMPQTMPERNELLRDALMGQAQAAYDAKDYINTLTLLDNAETHAATPRYASFIRGWSLFQAGQPEKASAVFANLYQEQPDQQSAEGVLNSMVKANHMEELNKLAVNEPLASMVKTYYGKKWFDQKHFLMAKDMTPEIFGNIGAIGSPRVTFLDGHRERSGQDGLSRLTQQVSGMEASWPLSPSSEMRMKLEHVKLDNGLLKTSGWQPTLEWQHESIDTIFRMQIGTTPSNGYINPTVVGETSLQNSTLWGNYKIAAYRRPVKESVLSYVGDRSNNNHGQVVRNGGELSAFRNLHDPWGISGKLVLENLTGHNVDDNSHFAVDGGISYNLKPEGFDYFSLSLGLGSEHYKQNLSGFSLGQGGYFSPQTYWRWGPAVDFLSAENKQFIVKGRVSIGGLYIKQDNSPSNTGANYNVDIQGAWRLNDYIQLGGSIVKRYAPDYSDFTTFGFLRILLEPRKSVLSADLPSSMSDSIY